MFLQNLPNFITKIVRRVLAIADKNGLKGAVEFWILDPNPLMYLARSERQWLSLVLIVILAVLQLVVMARRDSLVFMTPWSSIMTPLMAAFQRLQGLNIHDVHCFLKRECVYGFLSIHRADSILFADVALMNILWFNAPDPLMLKAPHWSDTAANILGRKKYSARYWGESYITLHPMEKSFNWIYL